MAPQHDTKAWHQIIHNMDAIFPISNVWITFISYDLELYIYIYYIDRSLTFHVSAELRSEPSAMTLLCLLRHRLPCRAADSPRCAAARGRAGSAQEEHRQHCVGSGRAGRFSSCPGDPWMLRVDPKSRANKGWTGNRCNAVGGRGHDQCCGSQVQLWAKRGDGSKASRTAANGKRWKTTDFDFAWFCDSSNTKYVTALYKYSSYPSWNAMSLTCAL